MLKFSKGDDKVGRPTGTNNNMRTQEEKEIIINEYLKGNQGLHYYERKYGISYSVLHKWYEKYQQSGLKGLISKTGKASKKGINKKDNSEEEKLKRIMKRIIMKQEIEIARLKKGYQVKGVGVQKEYITTFEKNMK